MEDKDIIEVLEDEIVCLKEEIDNLKDEIKTLRSPKKNKESLVFNAPYTYEMYTNVTMSNIPITTGTALRHSWPGSGGNESR